MSAVGPPQGANCARSGGVGVVQRPRDETIAREKPMLLTGNHAVAWAARLARPRCPALSDHAANSDSREDHRIPG